MKKFEQHSSRDQEKMQSEPEPDSGLHYGSNAGRMSIDLSEMGSAQEAGAW